MNFDTYVTNMSQKMRFLTHVLIQIFNLVYKIVNFGSNTTNFLLF